MFVLGISAYYHDSAATLLQDGAILASAQEERFTRKKHDSAFPKNAVKYCLDHAGISLEQVELIVFYDKPLLKFERLLETFYAFAPKGLHSFVNAMPVWIKEKVMLKQMLREALQEIHPAHKVGYRFLFPEHHLSHAASAYYPSPYSDAAILTVDGVGEWATASIAHGQGADINILRELKFPHSVGLLYSAFTYFLGFRVNSGEYKLMGLAPYGNPDGVRVQDFYEKILKHMIKLYPDGSIWLDQRYFDYATGLTMVNDRLWETLFGFPRREPESATEQVHCDLALAIQRVTEDIVLNMAKEAKRLTGSRNLCMAGGVALNCVANGKLLQAGIFENLFIQPAAGDAGGALGAAYCGYHLFKQQPRVPQATAMQGAYLGPEYSKIDVERVIRKYDAQAEHFSQFSELAAKIARVLAEGNVVGWVQGRSEWGPRSLGNRSILGDARNPEMQKKLNLKIKYRESFRPFAPVVRREEVAKYFELNQDSPYMLLVAPVAKNRQVVLPENYHEMSLRDKLYYQRSDLPAITHLDYSARVQTVHHETNPRFHELISAFASQTGCGVLVNTSFNVRGEPIVLTPEDAYRCFMRTEMDYLVVGDYVFAKGAQPLWRESAEWKQELALD